MEITDYLLSMNGLWIEVDNGKSSNRTASFETVAGVLYDMGLTDGYTLWYGEINCIMDERPGFPAGVATVQQVWNSIGGDLREEVAKKCIA